MKNLFCRLNGLPIVTMLAALSGCMYMNHDETHARGMDAVVGQSFTTVQDAFLIKDSCVDKYDAKYCSQLQVVQGYYYVKDPKAPGSSLRMLKLPADQQILAISAEAAARLTWVPKGTTLKVVQLESLSLGQYRRCWVVYAALPQFPADRVAEIPACLQWAPEAEPMWFKAQAVLRQPGEESPSHDNTTDFDFLDKPPLPDPAFLIPAQKP